MDKTRFNAKTKIYPSEVKTTVFSYPVYNPNKCETVKLPRRSYEKNPSNDSRSDSVKRAKDKVFDIATINGFTLFVTLTCNDNILDASSISDVIKAFKDWAHNMSRRYGMVYLFLPEYHKDGKRLHFHGLVKGNLRLVDSGHKDKGRTVYNVDNWKYGFSTAIPLDENTERVANYVTKYITKDMKRIAGNFYFAGGKGLKRKPDEVFFNTDFKAFDGKEYTLPFSDLAKVKYRTDRIEALI